MAKTMNERKQVRVMARSKKIIILLSAVLLVLVLSIAIALFQQPSKIISYFTSYKVTDSRGVEVTFEKTPEKIISLMPSDTEIIYDLGLGDNLIAVSKYDDYPADTKNKTKLDSGTNMNVESVLGLKPDVVVLGKTAQNADQYKQLENAGIKVIVTDANNIEETYKVIEMLGKVFKTEAKAAEIINGMKKGFEEIKAEVAGKPSTKVYVEISPVAYGPWTGGQGTFQDELLTLVGAVNIFHDVSGWQQISEEQVITRNPDVIITTDMYSYPDPVGEIKGRAIWANVAAIKNNKVFLTDSNLLNRPGPRLVDAAKELVSIIYGGK